MLPVSLFPPTPPFPPFSFLCLRRAASAGLRVGGGDLRPAVVRRGAWTTGGALKFPPSLSSWGGQPIVELQTPTCMVQLSPREQRNEAVAFRKHLGLVVSIFSL